MLREWEEEAVRDVVCEYGATVGRRNTEKSCEMMV